MRAYYGRNATHCRFDALTLEMLRQRGKAPTLGGKAAKCRLLVPVGKELTERLLSADDPHEEAVRSVAAELNECYNCLTTCDRAHLEASTRRLCGLGEPSDKQAMAMQA